LILIGHVDSHRTPIIFQSSRWVSAYQAFTTFAFICFLGQVILYSVGTFLPLSWIWPVSIASALCASLLAALCIQADQTPFSAGANDNATGAALILTLAERLKSEPLQLTRVWFLCSGSEEVQHYGAIDFYRRHRHELQNPVTIVFESLGCADPSWLVKEGIIIPFYADQDLISLAEKLAHENPQWGASPTRIRGGNTEMADALRAGVPAITLIGMDSKGQLPYWHQVEDTYDKLDREVMSCAYSFSWKMIQELDR
jgi:Zn-dependent M28 family amino/carboxypeptidase